MNYKSYLVFLIAIAFNLHGYSQNQIHSQDWTHYVRTAGHGVEINQIHAVMEDARQTHLFGIEVDNDITGRYKSLLFPDQKLRALKAMADSAHATNNYAFVYTAGLECITDLTMLKDRSFFLDHPNWVQRNRNGEPAIFGFGDAFWIDKNSEDVWISPFAPEWRKLYMKRIRQIAATGIDGVYIDIPYWMTHFEGWEDSWASFDSFTVAEFKKRTGIDAFTDFELGDWEDPEFIAWVDFRINSITEFMAEIDRNVKMVNPNCKTIAEIYPGIDEAVARVGADVYEIYSVVDVIAHEFNPGNNSAQREPLEWLEYMVGMYTFKAFAEGKATWMLSYSWDGEENILPADAMRNLAMSQVMAGANSWDAHAFVMSGSNDYKTRAQIYEWIDKYENLIYAPRETLTPVGIYFSPKTRDYFSNEWVGAYAGIFNLLLREHIEFEIITPRTLDTANSNILILPDVKCVGDKEYAKFKKWLKNGKSLIYTGETGYFNENRVKFTNRIPMQELSSTYEHANQIKENPGSIFYHSLKENFNKEAYEGKAPIFENSEVNQLLEHLYNTKGYSAAIKIENADVCVAQIASVHNKPTVFLANFSGLKGSENANPFPQKDVIITFNNVDQNADVVFLPFMGKPQKLKGKWKNGNIKVNLPNIFRGAIIHIQ